MWRRWFKIFGVHVVMTEDYDGEIRFRFAKTVADGMITSKIYGKIFLKPDGTVRGSSYVKRWTEI
jgi:hypothetical protein